MVARRPGPRLKDEYGLCWQIVPTALTELLSDPDPRKAGNAMKAMIGMKKIDIAAPQASSASLTGPSGRSWSRTKSDWGFGRTLTT